MRAWLLWKARDGGLTGCSRARMWEMLEAHFACSPGCPGSGLFSGSLCDLSLFQWKRSDRNGPEGAVSLALQYQSVDHDRGQTNSPDFLVVQVQCCLLELSAMMEMLCTVLFSSRKPQLLLNTRNVTSATEELNFTFYLFLIIKIKIVTWGQ